jgi:hypothetical protein
MDQYNLWMQMVKSRRRSCVGRRSKGKFDRHTRLTLEMRYAALRLPSRQFKPHSEAKVLRPITISASASDGGIHFPDQALNGSLTLGCCVPPAGASNLPIPSLSPVLELAHAILQH